MMVDRLGGSVTGIIGEGRNWRKVWAEKEMGWVKFS